MRHFSLPSSQEYLSNEVHLQSQENHIVETIQRIAVNCVKMVTIMGIKDIGSNYGSKRRVMTGTHETQNGTRGVPEKSAV